MVTSHAPLRSASELSHARVGLSNLAPPRSRTGMAFALTAFAVLFGAALVAAYGTVALLLYLPGLVVPLTLLWLSRDVFRADETEPR